MSTMPRFRRGQPMRNPRLYQGGWVQFIPAIISAISSAASMFGKKKTQTDPNAWLRKEDQGLIDRTKSLADRPYTPYQNDLVAGPSANQERAMTLAAGPAGAEARGYVDKAGAMAGELAGSGWDTATSKKYMNPYIEDVLQPTLRNQREAYTREAGAIDARAAGMNAFGSDRSAVAKGTLERGYLREAADTTKAGYATAYNTALNTWQADNQRRQAAITAYQSVGGDIQKLTNDQISNLMETGNADRVIQQMKLTSDYSQWIEQRDWQVNNLEPLMKAIGIAHGAKETPITQEATSKAGDIMGAASTLVGLWGKMRGGGAGGITEYTPTAKVLNS